MVTQLDGNFLLVHGLGNASGSAMPPLSPCLRGTFLAWVPCAFLWLAAPFEFYRMACTEVAGLKWTAASSAKLVFSASITTAHMSLLLTESSLLQEEFTGTVLKLFTLLMACTLQSMTRVAGLSSSAVQFVFWLLFSTSSAITSVSVYTDPVELKSWSRSGTIIQFFIMALSLIELGMSSFADLSRREKLDSGLSSGPKPTKHHESRP
ncbi:multidrug resistance-associated protein 1-like [Haemaphysalis longicornis]